MTLKLVPETVILTELEVSYFNKSGAVKDPVIVPLICAVVQPGGSIVKPVIVGPVDEDVEPLPVVKVFDELKSAPGIAYGAPGTNDHTAYSYVVLVVRPGIFTEKLPDESSGPAPEVEHGVSPGYVWQ